MNTSKAGKATKVTALALIVALSVGTPFTSVYARDNCDIDRDMEIMLKGMNKAEDRIIEDGVKRPVTTAIGKIDVKKGSCLPALDAFDALMRMRMPSFGALLGGFFQIIKDMACKFANDFIDDQINSIDLNFGDPYGIFNIGIGGTTHGNGGFTNETYDVSQIVSDAAMNAITNAIGSQMGGVGNIGSGLTGPKDRIPKIENTIGNGVRDAFKGL